MILFSGGVVHATNVKQTVMADINLSGNVLL